MTTRAPRPGEIDGRDYLFVDRPTFERLRDEGGFLECFDVYGDLKGTPRAPVEEALAAGQDVLLRKDVQGALAIKEQYPEAVVVFVRPPSRTEQRRRMVERGDGPEDIERRLAASVAEERLAARFDAVVVNDDLDRAAAEVAAILEAHRAAAT